MLSPSVRNVLLVMLTMTSGCVDAISFLKLGQVFTAAMTGNTVLFGLALSHSQGLSFVGYAFALLGFMLGAAVSALLLNRQRAVTGWSSVVTWSLWIELSALVLCGVLVSTLPASALAHLASLLVLILAFAMGVQGVAARRIGVNAVTTTVITSTLTGLVETVVWKAIDKSNASRSQIGETTKSATSPIQSVFMWITVIVFYGVGAGVCGLFIHHLALEAVWLPVCLVLVVITTEKVCRLAMPTYKTNGTTIN